MAKDSTATVRSIHKAAQRLFYEKGIRAVSMDVLAEVAGITKKTLYYHFRSKDELIAAYLEARDAPNLQAFQKWFGEEAERPIERKIEALFLQLSALAKKPKWKGCGFLRTAAELVDMPGHPAIKAASNHKKNVERWLAEEFAAAGLDSPPSLARQVALLLDGALSIMLVHGDVAYIQAAGEAASTLVRCGRRQVGSSFGEPWANSPEAI